jgi:hypothetical protein
MRLLQVVARSTFGAFLGLHGAVHAMGALGAWGLATFEGVSPRPNILLDDASDGVLRLLGGLWLLAGVAFVVAGVGVLRRDAWSARAGAIAALASLVVTVLWKDDAPVGLAINVAVLVALAVAFAQDELSSGRGRSGHGDVGSPA